MKVQARNHMRARSLNTMRLCSDRIFSVRITGKYFGMRKRFPAMPQMIFKEKTARLFAISLKMLLSFPLRVINRYALNVEERNLSVDQTVYVPSFTTIFSHLSSGRVQQEFYRKQIIQNILTDHRAYIPFTATALRGPAEKRIQYAGSSRYERFAASFTEKFMQHSHRTFIDRISKRQRMLGEEANGMHEVPFLAVQSETAGIHASAGGIRKSLSEEGRELVFLSTNKIEREIDEMKRIVKKSEDRVQEKVSRQLSEISAEKNRQVDVGQLTQQVYRNMERMIRIERERRGI